MAKVTTQTITSNQLHVDYNVGKIFVWDNKHKEGNLRNSTGGILTFEPGTLLGRESDTGDYVILRSAVGTKGENTPAGILATSVVDLADAASAPVHVCIFGEVVKDKVIFEGADGFNTIVALKTLEERIQSDTMGIKLVNSTSMTKPDNA